MNREQKMAWLFVTVFVLGLIGFFVLWRLSGRVDVAQAAFGVVGVAGLGPLVFRKRPGQGVEFDERDRAIQLRATIGGFAVSYVFFVLVLMGIWFYSRQQGWRTISPDVLPQVVMGGFIAAMLVRSVAMLAMYRWGRVAAEE